MLRIALIDDAKDAGELARALRCFLPDCKIDILPSVQAAYDYQEWSSIHFIILDIMMYHGPLGPDETEDGFLSGLILLRWFAQEVPRIPIGVLTCLQGDFLDRVESERKQYDQVVEVWSRPMSIEQMAKVIERSVCGTNLGTAGEER